MDQAARKPRTRIQIEKRELILEAALEIFAQHGFRGATIDQIADAAGMSKPNLLYYFKSKDDIHRTLIQRLLDTWLAPLREIDDIGDPVTELRSYIRRKLEMARDYPRESRLFANEILQGAPRVLPMLEGELKSLVDGRHENWPIAGSYIQRTVGRDWKPEFTGTPQNFEEASLAMMPRPIYEKFVKGYTEKQWGVPATTLSAGLAKRFDVREDDEPRLMRHKHQGIPAGGYTQMMTNMLAGIPLRTGVDYLQDRAAFQPRVMTLFTGPIDEYFGCDLGRLAYRGQKRTHEYLPGTEWFQPCGQVNNPSPADGPHVRTLEWKHMMAPEAQARTRGTLLTRETPYTPTSSGGDCEYPFPDERNTQLYERYRERAVRIPGLLVCGRLGEYRYYDMDQAIARAQMLARRVLAGAEMPQAA